MVLKSYTNFIIICWFKSNLFVIFPTLAFCDKSYTTSSGTVTSPSYSSGSSYDNNLDCKYDIRVSSGSGIHLQWSTFNIKGKMPNCDDDYVEIYIGCGRHSIGRYCSDNTGGNRPFEVYSPDSCLRLKFHSDGSGTGTGFKATYSSFSQRTLGNLYEVAVTLK